jgi:hypothetical protein
MTRAHPQVVRQATDDNQKTSDGLLNGKDLAQGRGYNAFWIDPGTRFGVVKGETRTSWIIDPPNGKIPWSDAGRKLAAEGGRSWAIPTRRRGRWRIDASPLAGGQGRR